MPIWRVSDDPEILLRGWVVWELPDGDRHFNGDNVTGREGCVSSKIVDFDPDTMIGTTRSGRRYKLDQHGSCWYPGGDAAYVWHNWCRINNVDPDTAKNVSEEYDITNRNNEKETGDAE